MTKQCVEAALQLKKSGMQPKKMIYIVLCEKTRGKLTRILYLYMKSYYHFTIVMSVEN